MEQATITLDPQAIEALRALQMPGRPPILLRVIDLFQASATTLIADLENALDNSDLAAVTLAAHTLKSSSANLGATALSAQSKIIEQHGRNGDLEACRRSAADIALTFTATLAAIADLRVQEAS